MKSFAIIAAFVLLGVVSAGPFPYNPTEALAMNAPEAIWDPIVEFCKGAYDGVSQTYNYDVKMVKMCIQAPVDIWAQILELYNYIKNMKEFNAKDIFNHLMAFVSKAINSAIPCIFVGLIVDKFVELIITPTKQQIMMSIYKTLLFNFLTFINDMIDMFIFTLKGEFFKVGQCWGQMTYLFILH